MLVRVDSQRNTNAHTNALSNQLLTFFGATGIYIQ